MKLRVPLSSMVILLASSSVLAADLTIPMAFEYLAVDGQQIDTNIFSHQAKIELTPGIHKIAIRYHDMVQDDFSSSESFIKSSPFIITLDVTGDYQYTLTPADGDYVKQPKTFAQSPQVLILRSDKQAVTYSVKLTDYSEDSLVTRLLSSGNDQDVTALSATATDITATPAKNTNIHHAAINQIAPTDATVISGEASNNHAQQMLQYWWLHADESTRKEFMSWAIKQL